MPAVTEYRLPLEVKPTHYDLTIRTDLERLEFRGVVSIDLDVLEDTPNVTFHASDLTIHEVTLYNEALKTEQLPAAQSFDEKAERATIQFSTPLTKGSRVKLRVGYKARLTGSMFGYYCSSYEYQGRKRKYALTQFQPTMARRAFPGWDEPLFKATYDITLVSRTDTVNLSNMPVESEALYPTGESAVSSVVKKLFDVDDVADANIESWKVTRFVRTPLVSSYLVAFANGPFSYLENSYTSPLSGRVRPLPSNFPPQIVTADLIHQAHFALDVKAKVLPIYEKVFDIEFPLPKLDTLVAHDFAFGAMENWGLIMGRTLFYLLDPERIDIHAKKEIASMQSHEVAHMWFGNITTMSWWDNLWLNEGFASLMGEVIILNKVFQEWKPYSAFYTEHLEHALSLDAKRSSHPIQVDVPDANQINQIADALTYSKAAAVLLMLSAYVGEEKFLKGVSIYLKKNLYANSVAEDLWAGIKEATDLDIPEMMTSWTSKIGFPVIRVTESPEGLRIRQDRFLDTGDAMECENQTIWQVPLNILATDADGKTVVDHEALLKTREMTYQLDVSKPWKLNSGSTGVYRVLYTPERLLKLGEEAARPNTVFSLSDRLGLVSDALATASSGMASVSSALMLIHRLRSEPEYLVWSAISKKLDGFVSVWWEQHPVVDDLKAFQRSLFMPIVRKLGYEYSKSESADVTQLRTLAVTQAAASGSKEVVNKLVAWFKQFVASGEDSQIPPDLVRATFITGAKYGGKKEWDALKKVYLRPSNQSAKISAIFGMCATQKQDLVEESFRFTEEFVLDQDVMHLFAGLSSNFVARKRAAEYVRDKYEDLYMRFEGNYIIKDLVQLSHSGLTAKEDAEKLEQFFKGKDTSKLSMVLSQTLDTIRAKAAWIERSKDDVAKWLEKWKKDNKVE